MPFCAIQVVMMLRMTRIMMIMLRMMLVIRMMLIFLGEDLEGRHRSDPFLSRRGVGTIGRRNNDLLN
jgi:hypothetical protein